MGGTDAVAPKPVHDLVARVRHWLHGVIILGLNLDLV
jgi:hypothetical protein